MSLPSHARYTPTRDWARHQLPCVASHVACRKADTRHVRGCLSACLSFDSALLRSYLTKLAFECEPGTVLGTQDQGLRMITRRVFGMPNYPARLLALFAPCIVAIQPSDTYA